MSLLEVVIIAIGLAMDAFAVSVVVGGSRFNIGIRPGFRLSLHFGLFQFLMPVLGWIAGFKIASYVAAFDHWIAFALLAYVGGKMFYDGLKGEEISLASDPTRKMQLILLSVATSIDALAVGFSFSLLSVNILQVSTLIGVITFAISAIGVFAGKFAGKILGKWATLSGGIILCLIGVKILLEHTMSR